MLALALQSAPELLETACVKCHNAKSAKGGLDLSTREGLLKTDLPRLLRLVRHEEEPKMPHKAPKLDDERIDLLRRWIDAGAPYARPLKAVEEEHWAFKPLRRPPAASIDALIDRALAARGLVPNPPADPRVLARRLSFDLTGLPDQGEDVDALLASPAFGERWARHWLDVARYADSSGYESDVDRPASHHYRDAVIRAFNADLPFDRFVRAQVAGDLLDPDHIALTGFCAVGPHQKTLPTDTERNKEKYRYDNLDDVVSTTAQAFLGLTIGCARCHDHKYDPLPQRDYYRLVAVFAGAEPRERSLSAPRRRLDEWLEARRAELRRARIDALPLAAEEKALLALPEDGNIVSSKRLHKAYPLKIEDPEIPAELRTSETAPKALCLFDGPAPATHLLGRGEPDEKKGVVAPGVLSALGGELGDGPPRAAFAAWLSTRPLLARVIVNRLWLHHFGEGLVRTPNDFGAQGERPTHPELLDWLASELIERRWSLKAIHRLIVTSEVYRRSTAFDPAKAAIDPDNRLWWRRRPRPLEAEALRDAMLAVSGRLDPAMFGPGVKIPVPDVLTRSKDPWPKNLQDSRRRSIYLFLKRSVALPWMETFDVPSAAASCGRRDRTTVAPQALALLNDPFVRDCARALAERAGDRGRASELALGRRIDVPWDGSLVDFCHVLFLLNEFAYVD